MRRPKSLEATSQLELGARGVHRGEAFTLTGRRCVQGGRGQIWNEWTVTFDGAAPPRFLAESWGTFTLYGEGSLLPPMAALVPGADVRPRWVVVERGTARRLATWGDLEEVPETYEYADFSSRDDARRASMAEGQVFVGEPVSALSLGLTLLASPPALVPAPNVSPPAGLETWLDVGDAGVLDGVDYRVLGVAARGAGDEHWEEYLLYNAHVGLRWISVADGHWTFAVPVDLGSTGYDFPADAGEDARQVRLEWTAGELPWSAEIGEQVTVSERDDYVFERTVFEVSAARTIELSPDEVARAFQKRSLPRPK